MMQIIKEFINAEWVGCCYGFEKISKVHIALLLVVTIIFIWSVIKPVSYLDWLAEVSPGVVILIIVIATYNKFRFTTLSYFIIAILSILTFIGGHYTYSEVPFFNWIQDEFDLQRNNYDQIRTFLKRIICHFDKGIIITKNAIN